MRKSLTLSCIFAMLSFMTLNAQMTLKVGPEAGIGLSKFIGKFDGEKIEDQKLGLGFKAGVILDLGINDMISIQPGVFFNRITQNLDGETQITVNDQVAFHSKTEGSQNINAVSVPVGVQFGFGSESKFFIGIGPQFDYFLTAKVKGTTTDLLNPDNAPVKTDEKVEWTDDDVRFNISGMVNAGYMMSNGLFIRASYAHGLTNFIKEGDSDNKINLTQIGVSIGYLFGGK